MNDEIEWNPDKMLEVTIKQPDDFLKVRETLTRIGVASRKDKTLYQYVISYINKVSILLYTLKSYLH